ncbi:hypothetical protein [Pseudogemmobacter sonorensis]|uniref:hypothetical protein n=1 Tax=Pseudogemmobacter sonorensis TaxID=2989681 RepID=UPI003687F4BE
MARRVPRYPRLEREAKVLDRGPEMSVESSTGPAASDLGVWVIARPYDDSRRVFEIDDIARELEVLL